MESPISSDTSLVSSLEDLSDSGIQDDITSTNQTIDSSVHTWISSITKRNESIMPHCRGYNLVNKDITEGQELYAVPLINYTDTQHFSKPNKFIYQNYLTVNDDYNDAFLQRLIKNAQLMKQKNRYDFCQLPAIGLQTRVYIKHTNTIKGWGLFAAENIRAGQIITSYTGDLLSMDESCRLVEERVFHFYMNIPDLSKNDDEELDDNDYRLVVDANRCGNVARFVNHSCDASLQPETILIRTGNLSVPQLVLVAKRDIDAHEELTCKYVPSFRPSFRSLIKRCQCKTMHCIEIDEETRC